MNSEKSLPHARRTLRLQDYDYSADGAYFVTMCTQNRECLLGQIPSLTMSYAGLMVQDIWNQIPEHYPGIETDEFVVMPNHVHGIIVIENTNDIGNPPGADGRSQGTAPTGLNLFDVIRNFKTLTTKLYADGVKQSGWRPFPGLLWQRNYYEHVIRSENELNDVRQYIIDNPLKWALDRENPEFKVIPPYKKYINIPGDIVGFASGEGQAQGHCPYRITGMYLP